MSGFGFFGFTWDVGAECLGLAIIGTTSILKAIKRSAPSVKRVVLTSSFAAINDRSKEVGTTYPEVSHLFCLRFFLEMFFLTDEGRKGGLEPND